MQTSREGLRPAPGESNPRAMMESHIFQLKGGMQKNPEKNLLSPEMFSFQESIFLALPAKEQARWNNTKLFYRSLLAEEGLL